MLILSWLACDGAATHDGPLPEPTETGSPTRPDLCAGSPGASVCDGDVLVTCSDDGSILLEEPCEVSCEAGACVGCGITVEVPWTDAAAVAGGGIVVEVDAGRHPARSRQVVVAGSGTASITGPFALLRADGAPVEDGAPVRDEVLRIAAEGPGEGALTIEASCGEGAALALVAASPTPLAGQALDDFPWFDAAHDLVVAGGPVDVLVDPERFPDRAGVTFELLLVPDRDAATWAADPSLADVAARATGVVDGVATRVEAPTLSAGTLLEDLDVVVDFGADGRLDPGDLLDGLDGPAITVVGDLAAPGPYTPVSEDASGPDQWLRQRLYAPRELDQLDPAPLVVISHGNGHDYRWYDWLGNHLASWGYVVMSHRNNTMPGPMAASVTTLDNLDWLLSNLDTIAGGALDGEIDRAAIVLVGHSRGGEGVVIAYDKLVRGVGGVSAFTADDIRLVSSIAPTLFEGPDTANPHDVPFHVLSGSADGDVTGGVNMDLTQYWRMFQRHTGLGLVTYVQGADHNDFNCCGAEDGAWVPAADRGPLIGRPAAQRIARSYYLATLEALLHERDVLWEVDARAPDRFRPIGVASPLTTQLRRASGDHKVVIDDFQTSPAPNLSSSGGLVTGSIRDPYEGALDDGDTSLAWQQSDPMNGMSWSHGDRDPARGLVFSWEDGDDGSIDFAVPAAAADLTGAAFVSVRVAQGSRHPNVVSPLLGFSVALVDAAGHETVVSTEAWGRVVRPYERGGLGGGTGWVNEFQTLRFPIAAFARDADLDLAAVATVRLRFGVANGSGHGRAAIDDLEILMEGAP